MNTNRNRIPKESVGVKQREASKDRNGLRKTTSLENASTLSSLLSSKSKPSVRLKESPSTVSTATKKTVKQDLDTKLGIKEKSKLENHKSTIKPTTKSSTKVIKTPTTANKISLSTFRQNNLTKSKRSTAPETPPSNRVTKTQYFPSKNLYSNVVKEQLKMKSTSSTSENINHNSDVTPVIKHNSKTKPLEHNGAKVPKPSKNKIEKSQPIEVDIRVPENTGELERPRTATLKRGSIVNSNIAGPDIPISETPSLTSLDLSYEQESKDEDEYNYEDDFDSYESEFEEYHSSDSGSSSSSLDHDILIEGETTTSDEESSSNSNMPTKPTGIDEEKMLDSGNFDLPENKHKQLLGNIKESNEHDNFSADGTLNSRSNMASLSDEGFEEGKSLNSGNMQFINFIGAQKKWKQNKNLEKRKKRGEEILSMIRLDQYNFTLIDMTPVPYDIFIKSYGKTNTVQVPTQTGDDDTCEEIQTDAIETANKWTQFPVMFSKINIEDPNYLELYKTEFLGVGDDFEKDTRSPLKDDSINYRKLENFLSFSSKIVTTLLDESAQTALEQINQNKKEIPFSSGYIKYDTKLHSFLKNRPVTYVSCHCTNSIQILTIHGRNKINHENLEDYLVLKSIICIWNTINSKDPKRILVVTGELCFCSFLSEMRSLIFGGLYDG